MTLSIARLGLAAVVLVVAGASAQAQDAGPQAAIQPVPCSGFMCILSGKQQSAQAPAPAATPVAAPAAAIVSDPADDVDTAPKARRRVRPAKTSTPVTIAADWTDVARLKQLVAVMPGSGVKLVAPSVEGADFKVGTTLGEDGRGTRLRLYSEQVHIIAGASVHTVADLDGKIVSFGPAGGQTPAIASKSFEALGVKVRETPLDYTNAFDGLASGDVDAVVVVAPQPSAYLAGLHASGLHLVSWPDDAAAPSGAAIGVIAGAGYPNLAKSGDKIRTVAVDAVLTMSAKGGTEPAARAFFAALRQHSAALSKRGFDLLKADLAARGGRRVASVEHR